MNVVDEQKNHFVWVCFRSTLKWLTDVNINQNYLIEVYFGLFKKRTQSCRNYSPLYTQCRRSFGLFERLL